MASGRHKLTADTARKILSAIRKGAYPWVAAEAMGIPRTVFERWLELGQGHRPRKKWRDFYEAVQSASAFARMRAEWAAFQKDPKTWLRSGPGKEQGPTLPGWSSPVKPVPITDNRTINIFATPEWAALFQVINQALAAFPDAQIALAAALSGFQEQPPSASSADPGAQVIDQPSALPALPQDLSSPLETR